LASSRAQGAGDILAATLPEEAIGKHQPRYGRQARLRGLDELYEEFLLARGFHNTFLREKPPLDVTTTRSSS
jgi:hypothetical protein